MEMYTLAQKVNLTGRVKNLPDGNVEAELQGEEAKVDFVIRINEIFETCKCRGM